MILLHQIGARWCTVVYCGSIVEHMQGATLCDGEWMFPLPPFDFGRRKPSACTASDGKLPGNEASLSTS